MRYTKTTLQKYETLLEELGYTIRYEKGNFQSGYCIVENRKIAVLNKFFDTEARINTLLEILNRIEVNPDMLSEASRKLYHNRSQE
jgi:alpha-glucuronidase